MMSKIVVHFVLIYFPPKDHCAIPQTYLPNRVVR